MKTLPYIIIIGLLVYIFFLRECTPKPPIQPTRVDTIKVNTVSYIPVIDTVIQSDTHTVYIPSIQYRDTTIEIRTTDTVFVYNDYFSRYFYNDVLMNDSNGFISVADTIYMNKIISRTPTIRLYSHPVKQRAHLFAGFGVSGIETMGVSGNIGLLTKRKNLYTIGYDPIKKDVSLRVYWRLF